MERTTKEVDVLLTEQLRLSSPASNTKTASLRPLPQPERIGQSLRHVQQQTTANQESCKQLTTEHTRVQRRSNDPNQSQGKRQVQPRRGRETKTKRTNPRKHAGGARDPPARKPRPAWNEDNKPTKVFDEYSKETAKRLQYTNAPRMKKTQLRSRRATALSKKRQGHGMRRTSLVTRKAEVRGGEGRKRGSSTRRRSVLSKGTRPSSVPCGDEISSEKEPFQVEQTSSECHVDKENCIPTAVGATRNSGSQTASIILSAPQPEIAAPVDAEALRRDRVREVTAGRMPLRQEVNLSADMERVVQKVLEKERDGLIRAAHQVYSREIAYANRREENKLEEELDNLIRLEDEILAKWNTAFQDEAHESDTAHRTDPASLASTRVVPKRYADFSRVDAVGNNPVRSILGGRRRFLHHRQMVEASLHGTGMSQWQIVESISDILVEELVTAASNEVCELCDEIADHLVRSV